VWFLDLAPMRDPALLMSEAARILGVREEPDKPLLRTLCAHLKSRRMLLILDNCEHLVEPSAHLANAILREAPPVRILASSREALRVPGEQHYPVLPLRVPSRGEGIGARSRSTLEQYEGVRLFVDRAMAAQPAFKVTDQNAAVVAGICQQLDGVPLAIELAAARVQALSVENIAAHLNDRFHLLAIGDRTALPRWRTLRALIDWSYDLLTARERTLFRRLAVFAGGWSLEAAEAVAAGGDIDHGDVLDLLAALVEKSLVIAETDGARYRLLETVRQYAQERLDESGESDVVRTQHVDFYVRLAEGARPGLAGPEHALWLARLDVEQQNLLSAHAWCDHADGGGERGLKLFYGVQPYFISRGILALGRQVAVEALMRPAAQAHTLARCRALHAAGWLGCYMGHYVDAQNHLKESQSIAREIGDQRRIAAVLQPLAVAFLGQGDMAMARRHADEALALEQELGDTHQIASALNLLAHVHRLEGNLDAAEPLYEQVVALSRQKGEHEVVALGMLNLAMVSIGRGLTARAATTLLEVIAIAEEIGSRPAGQSVLDVSAGLAARLADWHRAARFFGAAQAQAEQTGLRRDPADEAFVAPLMAKVRQALGDVAFASHQLAGSALSYEKAVSEALSWLRSRS
jgi:predicted ATPase